MRWTPCNSLLDSWSRHGASFHDVSSRLRIQSSSSWSIRIVNCALSKYIVISKAAQTTARLSLCVDSQVFSGVIKDHDQYPAASSVRALGPTSVCIHSPSLTPWCPASYAFSAAPRPGIPASFKVFQGFELLSLRFYPTSRLSVLQAFVQRLHDVRRAKSGTNRP